MVLLRSADSGLNERRVIAVIMSVTVFISIKSSAFFSSLGDCLRPEKRSFLVRSGVFTEFLEGNSQYQS